MLKKFLFAIAPLFLITGSLKADDDLFSKIAKLDADTDATAEVNEADEFGKADIDALMGDDDESDDEAIAACFRRYGYGYGHRHHYRSYSYSYYTPVYRSYNYNYCYTPTYHYTPVTYSYYTPCYTSYWGW